MKYSRSASFGHRTALSLMLVVAVSHSGCSFFAAPGTDQRAAEIAVPQEATDFEVLSPFKVDVIEERNTGKDLYVHGRLMSLSSRSVRDVAVRLSAFREGDLVEEATFPLTEILTPRDRGRSEISAGSGLEFAGHLRAEGFTDYQLEILWGEDAASITGERKQPADRGEAGLYLQNVQVQPYCEGSRCEGFVLLGELFNSGSAVVKQAEIGVGVVFVPRGGGAENASALPEEEQVLELADVSLAPQQVQPVRFVFDGPFPQRPGGVFRPVARVISYR